MMSSPAFSSVIPSISAVSSTPCSARSSSVQTPRAASLVFVVSTDPDLRDSTDHRQVCYLPCFLPESALRVVSVFFCRSLDEVLQPVLPSRPSISSSSFIGTAGQFFQRGEAFFNQHCRGIFINIKIFGEGAPIAACASARCLARRSSTVTDVEFCR